MRETETSSPVKLCKDCKFFRKDKNIVFMFSSHAYRYGKCTKFTTTFDGEDKKMMYITGKMPKVEYSFAKVAREYRCGLADAKYWEPKE